MQPWPPSLGCGCLTSSSEDISIYGSLENHTLYGLGYRKPDIPCQQSQPAAPLHSTQTTSACAPHAPPPGSQPSSSEPAKFSPLFTSRSVFIIFFTLLRSFWSLKTQETYVGIINPGKVFMLPQRLHPYGSLWNSSSAVAPSCDLPLNPGPCPNEASQDTCYEY